MLILVGFFGAFLFVTIVVSWGLLFGQNLSERQTTILVVSAFCIAALIFISVVCLAFYESFYPFPQEKPTKAILTRTYLTSVGKNSRRTTEVTVYEYEVAGIKHEGQFIKENPAIESYKLGDTIDVIYDANQPVWSEPSYRLYNSYFRPEMEKYIIKIQRGEGKVPFINQ